MGVYDQDTFPEIAELSEDEIQHLASMKPFHKK
jgi:hypothetical protein